MPDYVPSPDASPETASTLDGWPFTPSLQDRRYSTWEQRGRRLANSYRADLWALGQWWIEGKSWSRQRAALVRSPDWLGPSAARLRTIAYVVRRMAKTSFQQDISFSHHEAVAPLDQGTATEFLHRAITLRWSVETLKGAVAAHRQSEPASNCIALPHITRRYTTILADPPWGFDHPIVDRRIQRHYPTLPIGEIMQLPVGDLATRDAYLFLWTPNSLLPEALATMNAWGFRYLTNMVWVKETRRLGTGNFWRNGHELLLLGLRGNAGGFVDKTLVSHLVAPPGRHSEKPEAVREMIERAVPGPYLELFARSRRDQWDVVWSDNIAS